MTFLTPQFFCFFPVTALVFFLLPQRARNPWLLLASWFFYLCAKPVYLTFLLFTIAASYLTGRLLERKKSKGHPGGLPGDPGPAAVRVQVPELRPVPGGSGPGRSGLLLLGPGAGHPDARGHLLLPVPGHGVRHRRVPGQGSGGAGICSSTPCSSPSSPTSSPAPIARANQLLPQFRSEHRFDWDEFRAGLFRFLWGAFKKLVLADRLAVLVNTIFTAPQDFGALQLAGAAVAFSLQLYCDFSSYSDMALGTARAMGFSLIENFRTPFFSRSIAEFWRRWHMSLSFWFRDYLYIPLGGSRRGTARKYLNVLIVFAVSGLWHGAAMTFVVWGLLNGLYQVIGGVTAPLRGKVHSALHLKEGRLAPAAVADFLHLPAGHSGLCVLQGRNRCPPGWTFCPACSTGPCGSSPAWAWTVGSCWRPSSGLVVLLVVDLRSVNHDITADYLSAPRPARWLALWFLLFSCVVLGQLRRRVRRPVFYLWLQLLTGRRTRLEISFSLRRELPLAAVFLLITALLLNFASDVLRPAHTDYGSTWNAFRGRAGGQPGRHLPGQLLRLLRLQPLRHLRQLRPDGVRDGRLGADPVHHLLVPEGGLQDPVPLRGWCWRPPLSSSHSTRTTPSSTST